MLQRHYYLL